MDRFLFSIELREFLWLFPIEIKARTRFMSFLSMQSLLFLLPFYWLTFQTCLLALIVLLCIDVSIHSPFSHSNRLQERIIKIHNLASILIKTNGASGGQFGLWNNGVRCAAKSFLFSTQLHYSLF